MGARLRDLVQHPAPPQRHPLRHPQERHEGRDGAILEARTTTCETAKSTHPDRWRTRPVRNWTPIGTVWLNPDREAPPHDESAATRSMIKRTTSLTNTDCGRQQA